jgi:hypothetical protein
VSSKNLNNDFSRMFAKVAATGAGRTTLTAGASHIMEARGTLGVRLQYPTGVLVPDFSATFRLNNPFVFNASSK